MGNRVCHPKHQHHDDIRDHPIKKKRVANKDMEIASPITPNSRQIVDDKDEDDDEVLYNSE